MVGASPEPMVRLREGTVISRPIAGSRRRGATPEEDARLEGELVEDPKEVAEHVMLVDLARNDVGRVVSFGTEVVEEMMVVERYSHIMHLTSQVSGRLAPGKGPIDVLRATLPAGTLSGAPKVRAMEIIDDLEPTKRGVYGGVVGYLDFSGNLDTAIAIRTMTVDPDGSASVQAGAGIVADSDPAAENAECGDKAAAMLSAVAMARAAARTPAAGAAGLPEPRESPEPRQPPAWPQPDRRRPRMSGASTGTGPPGQITEGYDALRHRAAAHQLARDVLSVSGPDATSYLQGQCSQDVSALGAGDSAEALLLSPQGKIDAYLRLTKVGDDAFVIDTDQGFGPVVTARLERFRLRMKVAIEPLEWICVALRGPDAPRAVDGAGRPAGPGGGRSTGPAWPVWTCSARHRPAVSPDGSATASVRCGDAAWEAARIEAGVPVNGREIVEGSIAAELGLVDRTVSFTKGCFTGQELVARLDARGSNVARRLCGVVVGDGRRPTPRMRAPRRMRRLTCPYVRAGRCRRADRRRLQGGRAPVVGGLVAGGGGHGGPGHAAPPCHPSRACGCDLGGRCRGPPLARREPAASTHRAPGGSCRLNTGPVCPCDGGR